ncbi:hypothetical protein PVAND_010391 [Polypedilum vanderplanki]|uniref:Guanylate cyclase n=1 Tax=Polypedilum vanderplanki TaxID=319348 RepID=A0A9J6CFE2_POLVA|nr:hypothetical protein PVAND_010391 [Polypedilum vanderplanki]
MFRAQVTKCHFEAKERKKRRIMTANKTSKPNWGLPLAIAANLHTPYRIEIGIERIERADIKDKIGKVLIICSPLNSLTTDKIVRKFKNYRYIKLLLIDMIGSVFSLNYNHESNTTTDKSRDNQLVLTILTQKYKYILSREYHLEFSRYLNLKSSHLTLNAHHNHTRGNNNSAIVCDSMQLLHSVKRSGNYGRNMTLCEQKIKEQCHNLKSNEIKFLCANITEEGEYTFNKQLVFSEHFNLFDFITSIVRNDDGDVVRNESNRHHQSDFIVLDFKSLLNATTFAAGWRPLMILEQNHIDKNAFILHHALSERDAFDEMKMVDLLKWKCGSLCWGIIAAIFLIIIVLILIISLFAGIAARNYFLRKRLSKGPNKVVLAPADFVFPIDSRRVDEGIEAMLCCWLQQLQEFGGPEVDKPDLLKGSIGSLKNLGLPGVASSSAGVSSGKAGSGTGSLVKQNNANMLEFKARYQGDLVQLKEIRVPSGNSIELRTKAMDHLIIAHGLRHENINPLIGFLSDPNRTALVFEHCSRGSLQDVLIMDEIKLDWSFRLSLLTDLVRGMRYLHSGPLRVHGSLTSRNCVVDARWVLKITDYGLPAFYEAQGLTPPPKSAKEQLWTAPEALRGAKNYPKCGTQAADVFSFGIIMQEVVVRGEPYCMLSLSPEEIIAKIKKPPPLIRPSVSKGAAPPEAINIMRQCWTENPEARPDFETIGEKFKLLNHGRKVNFVDTMFQMLEKYSNNLEELIKERTEQLDMERKKTEQLLNRMLPSSVAEKLKMGLAVDPEIFSEVTIYFSDIVGFTTIAAHCTPVQVVDLLNDLYTCFDATIMSYPNVYKVETIGDAYMVVGGLPNPRPDHAEQIATMALELLHQSGNFKVRHLPGVPLQLRIGLHTGPCCAGVVGLTMPRYCLFGDTVNTASRMESTGSSWRIHMSQTTCELLDKAGSYIIEPRGLIEIKGKGKMNTYWLLGKKGFDKPLPTPPPIGESHGLDELLKRNCEMAAAKATSVDVVRIANANSTQSSHSPSVTGGESLDVKVEITPAPPTPMSDIPNSFSIESTSSLTICSDISSKSVQSTSPNTRKLSELPPMESGGFLNPIANFNRMNPSPPNTASARLFKKLEEMIDLSLPYNHYRCLSPSETNLSNPHNNDKATQVVSPNSKQLDSGKPGSSRLLRRQFSLDKDDLNQKHNLETISSLIESSRPQNFTLKSQYQPLISSSSLPASSAAAIMQCNKLQKHQSASMTQDLEKIEEINVDSSPNNSTSTMSITTSNSFKRSRHNNSFRHTTSTAPPSASISNDRNDFKFH